MDYHDKAIKSMLDNLELMTPSTNKNANMNLHPMYGCSFDNKDENKKSTEKTHTDKYEVFRKNHFEVFITDPVENKVYEDLRLCTHSIDVNLYSGKIVFKAYATKNTLEIISNFRPHQKLNLKYVIYSPDASIKFVAYDDVVFIEDISFSSCSYVDQSKEIVGEIVTLTFKSKDTVM